MAQPFLLLATESLLVEGILGVIMSSLRKQTNKYYARVFKFNKITQRQELVVQIPLLTESKSMAKKRQHWVNVNEQLIKDGEITDINNFFPWLNDHGQSKITNDTLGDATARWYDSREKQPNLRPSTKRINKVAINHMISAWGKTIPIAEIKPTHISFYIEEYSASLNHSVNNININLRVINTFFKWLVSQDYINKMPQVSQLSINEPEVKYLSERDIALLVKTDLSKPDSEGRFIRDWNHYRRAFSMYISTGMRRTEAFLGNINGQWLDIPASESKTHRKRMIRLDDIAIDVINEMREKANSRQNPENAIKSYSNVFRRAKEMLGLNKDLTLHSLRHTFGCIRRLETNGNMIQVRDEMGHRNINTTERYCRIPMDRLADDFPSYVNTSEIGLLRPNTKTKPINKNKID